MGYTHNYGAQRAATPTEWKEIVKYTKALLKNLPEHSASAGGHYHDHLIRLAWNDTVNLGPEVGRDRIHFNGSNIAAHYAAPQIATITRSPFLPMLLTNHPLDKAWTKKWTRAFHSLNHVPHLPADDRDMGHDTFILEAAYHVESWGFCKTARKPYDLVVCSVLILCHTLAPGFLAISSDGDVKDWQPAFDWVNTSFPKLGVTMPITDSTE